LEIIKPGTKIDFVKYRLIAFVFSWVLILIGFGSILVKGPNYGIDFSGGTLIHLRFTKPMTIGALRASLASVELGESIVQDLGQERAPEFLVRVEKTGTDLSGIAEIVKKELERKLGPKSVEILRSELVGPKVGKELRTRALLAVLFSTIAMGIYIWFRFELRFGLGTVVAMIHDVLITLGAISLAGIEFDLTIVAALLTVVGYSVNDTVVICDRIRENMRKNRRELLSKIINLSLNETLSRTLLTGVTVFLVLLTLFFFGGSVIHGFAFALLVGFLIGTYSSIFVASPIVLYWERLERRRTR
jgi:preprotein translocase subunit SecF